MWNSRTNRTSVVCIACGTSLLRAEAREYDKEGDRWSRTGKQFEHLCKECDNGLCHQPRDDLEATLTAIEAGGLSRDEFLARFLDAVNGGSQAEEP